MSSRQTARFFSQPVSVEGHKPAAEAVAGKAGTVELPAVSSSMAAMTAVIRTGKKDR